jgi:hypothetical protein
MTPKYMAAPWITDHCGTRHRVLAEPIGGQGPVALPRTLHPATRESPVGRRLPWLRAWVRPAAAGFTGAAAQRYHDALLGHDTTPPWAPDQQEHGAIECPRGDTLHTHTHVSPQRY